MNSIINKDIRRLIVVGAGGLGREVAWLIEDINRMNLEWNFLGFIDDGAQGTTVESYPILGTVDHLLLMEEKPWVVVAIADAHVRKTIIEKLMQSNFRFGTLIHPSVKLSKYVNIGQGSIICCGSILTTNVTIGDYCILNPGCFIGHDTVLEDYVSIMPGANIAGEAHIGSGCYFGLSSCVINKIKITDWSKIGAGAVVIKDIREAGTYVGVPARKV